MERERDKLIKKISQLKMKRKKIISNGSDETKLKNIEDVLESTLGKLIKKVIDMHIFKQKFNKNPSSFYKSRRLFVTFKNFQIAREFKDCLLYTSPSPRDLSTSRMPSSA